MPTVGGRGEPRVGGAGADHGPTPASGRLLDEALAPLERNPTEAVDARPLMLAAAGGALVVVLVLAFRDQFWATNPALPVVQAIVGLGAAQTAFLLASVGGTSGLTRVRWVVPAYLGLAVAALLRAFLLPSTALGDPAWERDPSVAAAVLLGAQSLFVVSVAAGALEVPLRPWRRLILGAAVAAALATLTETPFVADLVGFDGTVRPVFAALAGGLCGTGLVVLYLWLRGAGGRPRLVELWIAISLAFGSWSLALRALSTERFTGVWWAATFFELAQAVVPALGIHLGLRRLYDALGRHEPELRARLVGEVDRLLREAEPEWDAATLPAAEQTRRAAAIRARIDTVLRDRAVTPVFQPIVDLDDGGVIGVEALARFLDETDPLPSRWFSDAAACGATEDLEILALERAFEALADLPAPLWMSVNVSPEVAMTDRFWALVSGTAADRLLIELTEHAVVDDYGELLARLARLRALGARFGVDDAGAGFSSLRHIVQLRPDFIKLDRSLTSGLEYDAAHRAMASALAEFSGRVGATLVAEGVETAMQAHALRLLGVGFAQGFYFSQPGPLGDVLRRVTGRGASSGRVVNGGD